MGKAEVRAHGAPTHGPHSSGRRRRVVLTSYVLGLGGTEKGLVNQAVQFRREAWDVRVVGVGGLGPRAAALQRAGISVETAANNLDRLTELFDGADIVHVFRQGNREPLVPAAARAAKVPVLVESNIFGHFDHSDDRNRFACHLFLSRFCLMRYRERYGNSSGAFHQNHRVQYLGLDLDSLHRRLPRKDQAKRALGLDPGRPVVGRLGRAADGKWRKLLVDMVPRLVDLVPEVQIMFVGATPAKRSRMKRLGVLERCVLYPTTADEERLATYYAACDVFVTAAEIGESQGVAICEAMACGLPVVTCSTPWADNAQIEFVEHGCTGLIANHPRPFAEAVAELLRDEERRSALGREGRLRAESRLDVRALTRQLEGLYEELLTGEPSRMEWCPGRAEVDAFPEEYQRRLRTEYAPLTTREQTQMRFVRHAERWREAGRYLNANLAARFGGLADQTPTKRSEARCAS